MILGCIGVCVGFKPSDNDTTLEEVAKLKERLDQIDSSISFNSDEWKRLEESQKDLEKGNAELRKEKEATETKIKTLLGLG